MIDSLIPPFEGPLDPCEFWVIFEDRHNRFVKVTVVEFTVELCPNLLLGKNEACLNITSSEHVKYTIQTRDLLE